jgi:hypothetical protein
MTTSQWKSGGKIFSVRCKGREYFPAFQFRGAQPHETVAIGIDHLADVTLSASLR